MFIPFLFVAFVALAAPAVSYDAYDQACVAKVSKEVKGGADSVAYLQDIMARIQDTCPKVK